MERINIDNQDLLNVYMDISNIIACKYAKLLELEINGNYDCEEYKKIIRSLIYYINKESILYNNDLITNEQRKELLDYIEYYKTPPFFKDNKESIFYQDYQYMIIRRIINRLLSSELLVFKLKVNGELIDAKGDTLDILKKSNDVKLEIDNDLYSIYLSMLNDLISKDWKQIYKNNFIGSKYYLSFINKDMENRLLKTRFKINNDIVLNSKDLSFDYGFDIDFYKSIKDNYLYEESVNYISKLLLIQNGEYNDDITSINALLIRNYIKSMMFLLSDFLIHDINYEYHEYIENKDYLNKNFDNSISEKLIVSIFQEIKRDRNNHKIRKLK